MQDFKKQWFFLQMDEKMNKYKIFCFVEGEKSVNCFVQISQIIWYK